MINYKIQSDFGDAKPNMAVTSTHRPVQTEAHHGFPFGRLMANWGWFQPTPLKNDGVRTSWDGWKFPTEWQVIKFHGSTPPTSYYIYSICSI